MARETISRPGTAREIARAEEMAVEAQAMLDRHAREALALRNRLRVETAMLASGSRPGMVA
jgi:hypothetical protein